ncbi:MAG: hypothetical protein IJF05_06605 [Clostridia bacterium]|nr:hypothetical protein [Clostridia bacterium]
MEYKSKPIHIFFVILGIVVFIIGLIILSVEADPSEPTNSGGSVAPAFVVGGVWVEIITVVFIVNDSRKHKKKQVEAQREKENRQAQLVREQREREYKEKYVNSEKDNNIFGDFNAWKTELFEKGIDYNKMLKSPWVEHLFADYNREYPNSCAFKELYTITRVGSFIVLIYNSHILLELNRLVIGEYSFNEEFTQIKDYLDNKDYRKTEILNIDDMLYWHITGDVETKEVRSGLGPSRVGLAVTEAVWGSGAAVSKAISANNTKTVTVDKRYIEALFSYEAGVAPFHTFRKNEAQMKMLFPEKMK